MTNFPLGPNERERLRVLHASGLVGGPGLPILDALTAEAKLHFGVDIAAVTLIDTDLAVFKAKSGVDGDDAPRNVAFCNYTILEDQVFVIPDTLADARFAANPLVTAPPHIRFYAGAPLVFQKGIRFGALCLLHSQPRDFTPGDRAELREMAGRAVSTIASHWFEIDSKTGAHG
ncbi:GAF domain-containing protein [Tabrizicola sp. BL-A-41-H6]|uniref:GAF domain-containing protein n=1 Tax=Tabrizicola sp. BL-A-41-H6 TaxID=3421107 RepID=UPI003D66D329